MKPIESEEQRQQQVSFLLDKGLATRKDAFKKLNPEMTDEQIEAKMQEIEDEKMERAAAFGIQPNAPVGEQEENEDGTEEDERGTEVS